MEKKTFRISSVLSMGTEFINEALQENSLFCNKVTLYNLNSFQNWAVFCCQGNGKIIIPTAKHTGKKSIYITTERVLFFQKISF